MSDRSQMQQERLEAVKELITGGFDYSLRGEGRNGAILDATNVVLGGLTANRVALGNVMVADVAGHENRQVWKDAQAAIIAAEKAVMAARDAQGRRELQLARWKQERVGR